MKPTKRPRVYRNRRPHPITELAVLATTKTGKLALHNTKTSLKDEQPAVTTLEYGTLEDAYSFFNDALFEGQLPHVLITLHRHPRARGYFSPKGFQRRNTGGKYVHEVALNPDSFVDRTDEEILSTLGHEMNHVWQHEYGFPGRGRYHNREWAAKMFAIGLMPSSTGKPGGVVTGDRVSHYIIEGGPFSRACREFLETHQLVWESAAARKELGERKITREKFTCPNCHQNAWAKPGARLLCGFCYQETHELIPLVPCGLEVEG
jgi:ribosomal protein S27AE